MRAYHCRRNPGSFGIFFHGNGHLPSHFYNNSAKHKIIFVIFDDVMTSKLT